MSDRETALVPLLRTLALEDHAEGELPGELARIAPAKISESAVTKDEPETEDEVEMDDKQRLALSFECLEQRRAVLNDKIRSTLNPAEIFVVEYLDPLQDQSGKLCGESDENDLSGVMP